MYLTTLMLVVFLTIILSCYLSLAELALSSVTKIDIKTKTSESSNNIKYLKKIMKNKDNYISAILILNTIINTCGSLLIGTLAFIAFKEMPSFITTIFVVFFTCSMLYFAEMIPKLYAIQNALKVSLFVSKNIYYFEKIIGFLVKLSIFVCSKFLPDTIDTRLSLSEVKSIIKSAQGDGIIKYEEAKIIKNTLKMSTSSIGDILMDSLDEIEYLDSELEIFNATDILLGFKHRRIIVLNNGNINEPIGVVLKSHILEKIIKRDNVKVKSLMHNLLILNIEDTLTHALIEFNMNEDHLAIVLSKDGNFEGVLSSEDILNNLTVGFKS